MGSRECRPGPLMSRVSAATLLAAERAIDVGADLIRRGRSHYRAMIAKGDRDYATAVDIEIERLIREALRESTRRSPFSVKRRD